MNVDKFKIVDDCAIINFNGGKHSIEYQEIFMQTYSYQSPELKVFGIPHFDKSKCLRRLPDSVLEQVPNPNLKMLGKRPPRLPFGIQDRRRRVYFKDRI